jgi:hypothetical protein
MAGKLNQFFTIVYTRDTTTSLPQLTETFEEATDPIMLTERMIKSKIAGFQKGAVQCSSNPNGITPKPLKMMGDSVLKPLIQYSRNL